jgi:hypothetical protein
MITMPYKITHTWEHQQNRNKHTFVQILMADIQNISNGEIDL